MAHFNRCLARKNPLPAQVFKPATFQVVSSQWGNIFQTGIWFSPINHFAHIGIQYSEGPSRGHKTTTVVTSNISQSLYIQTSNSSLSRENFHSWAWPSLLIGCGLSRDCFQPIRLLYRRLVSHTQKHKCFLKFSYSNFKAVKSYIVGVLHGWGRGHGLESACQ